MHLWSTPAGAAAAPVPREAANQRPAAPGPTEMLARPPRPRLGVRPPPGPQGSPGWAAGLAPLAGCPTGPGGRDGARALGSPSAPLTGPGGVRQVVVGRSAGKLPQFPATQAQHPGDRRLLQRSIQGAAPRARAGTRGRPRVWTAVNSREVSSRSGWARVFGSGCHSDQARGRHFPAEASPARLPPPHARGPAPRMRVRMAGRAGNGAPRPGRPFDWQLRGGPSAQPAPGPAHSQVSMGTTRNSQTCRSAARQASRY